MAKKRRRLRVEKAGSAGHLQGCPGELEKPGYRFCFQVRVAPSIPQPCKQNSGEEMGGNSEKLAVRQLHPGRCGREEGGAQPRPLVTRCHLLLPRRRLA